jgi:hypothetical protein
MKSRPFKILGRRMTAGIASVVGHRLPWFPQAIAEVDRVLLNFDARFLVRPKSNTLEPRRAAYWDK